MPNQGPKTVRCSGNSRLLRTLKHSVSALALGLGLGIAVGASAQPTNFVVDITDPNVDVDLSVLNDGGLSPQMPAPMPGGHGVSATTTESGVFKTPGTDVPVSTLHIKPASRFNLPPQTKPIEAAPAPQVARAPSVPSAPEPQMAAAPEPVEVEPVPERLTEPEQVVSAPPPPPAIEEPAPAPEVAEVTPPAPDPEPMPEAQPAPEPAVEAAPEPAEEVAAVSPPPPPPVVEEEPAVAAPPPPPAPEPMPEPAAEPTPPPQPIVKAPEPPAPPAAPPMPPKAEAPGETAALTPPPAPEPPKASQTVVPLPPKEEPAQTASLPPADGPLSDGDSLRILFDADSSKLPQSARDALAAIAEKMQGQDNLRLQLLAFAGDEDTSASAARRLSLSRALAVRSYLIESGVRSTRIDVRALGNKSTEAVTERVDITVVER